MLDILKRHRNPRTPSIADSNNCIYTLLQTSMAAAWLLKLELDVD